MKFSLSYRIDSVSPSHVQLTVFSAMIADKIPHDQATRARSGSLVKRTGEFYSFVLHTRPHLIRFLYDGLAEKLAEYTEWSKEREVYVDLYVNR